MLWVKCMLLHWQPPSKTLLPWRTLLFPQPQQALGKSKVPNGANMTILPLGKMGGDQTHISLNTILTSARKVTYFEGCPIFWAGVLLSLESSWLLFWLKDEHLKIFLLFAMWVALLVTYKLVSDRLAIHWLKIFILGSCFINCSLEAFYIIPYLLAWEEKFYPPRKFSIVSLSGSHTKRYPLFIKSLCYTASSELVFQHWVAYKFKWNINIRYYTLNSFKLAEIIILAIEPVCKSHLVHRSDMLSLVLPCKWTWCRICQVGFFFSGQSEHRVDMKSSLAFCTLCSGVKGRDLVFENRPFMVLQGVLPGLHLPFKEDVELLYIPCHSCPGRWYAFPVQCPHTGHWIQPWLSKWYIYYFFSVCTATPKTSCRSFGAESSAWSGRSGAYWSHSSSY